MQHAIRIILRKQEMRPVTSKGLGTVHGTVVEWKGPASGVIEFFYQAPAMVLIALMGLNPQASGILASLSFSFLIFKKRDTS